MVDKNNRRLHTANKFFIKSREDPEKVTGEKTMSSIFISFYLIWLQEFWQTFILWDDRFIHAKAHHHSALKWLCVCWHQPSWRKLNGPKYFQDRFFFFFSSKYILWGMQVDKTASGLKGAKKNGDLDMVWLHLPTNPLQRCSFILAIASAFWVSRCAQPRISAHCSYDNKQIAVKQLRWRTEGVGRVGSTRVQEHCMLFECLSGQVDWE